MRFLRSNKEGPLRFHVTRQGDPRFGLFLGPNRFLSFERMRACFFESQIYFEKSIKEFLLF